MENPNILAEISLMQPHPDAMSVHDYRNKPIQTRACRGQHVTTFLKDTQNGQTLPSYDQQDHLGIYSTSGTRHTGSGQHIHFKIDSAAQNGCRQLRFFFITQCLVLLLLKYPIQLLISSLQPSWWVFSHIICTLNSLEFLFAALAPLRACT